MLRMNWEVSQQMQAAANAEESENRSRDAKWDSADAGRGSVGT